MKLPEGSVRNWFVGDSHFTVEEEEVRYVFFWRPEILLKAQIAVNEYWENNIYVFGYDKEK